jgi:hypothetical protein
MITAYCASFSHVLDRVIGLVHFTSIGYRVVCVGPNSVTLVKGSQIYRFITESEAMSA